MNLGLGWQSKTVGHWSDMLHHLIGPIVAWSEFGTGLVGDAGGGPVRCVLDVTVAGVIVLHHVVLSMEEAFANISQQSVMVDQLLVKGSDACKPDW